MHPHPFIYAPYYVVPAQPDLGLDALFAPAIVRMAVTGLIVVTVAALLAFTLWGKEWLQVDQRKWDVLSTTVQIGTGLAVLALALAILGFAPLLADLELTWIHLMLVAILAVIVWNYQVMSQSPPTVPDAAAEDVKPSSSSSRSKSSSSSSSRPSSSSKSSSSLGGLDLGGLASSSKSKPTSSSVSKSSSGDTPVSHATDLNALAHPSATLAEPMAKPWPFPIGYVKADKYPLAVTKNPWLWWENDVPGEPLEEEAATKATQEAPRKERSSRYKRSTANDNSRASRDLTGDGGDSRAPNEAERKSRSATKSTTSEIDFDAMMKGFGLKGSQESKSGGLGKKPEETPTDLSSTKASNVGPRKDKLIEPASKHAHSSKSQSALDPHAVERNAKDIRHATKSVSFAPEPANPTESTTEPDLTALLASMGGESKHRPSTSSSRRSNTESSPVDPANSTLGSIPNASGSSRLSSETFGASGPVLSAAVPTSSDQDFERKNKLARQLKLLLLVALMTILNPTLGLLGGTALLLFLVDDVLSPNVARKKSSAGTDQPSPVPPPTSGSSSLAPPSTSKTSSSTGKSSSSSRSLGDIEKDALPTSLGSGRSSSAKSASSSKTSGNADSADLPDVSMLYLSQPDHLTSNIWKVPEYKLPVQGKAPPSMSTLYGP